MLNQEFTTDFTIKSSNFANKKRKEMSDNQNNPQPKPTKVDRYNVIPIEDGLYHLCVYNVHTEQYDETQLTFSSRKDAELHALKLNLDSKPLTQNLYVYTEIPTDNTYDNENIGS